MMKDVVICDNDRRITEVMVAFWQRIADCAIERRGYWTLVLSGGKTPVSLYRELAARPDALPWSKAHIFFADERFVSYRSPRSSYGMIRKRLIDPLSLPSTRVHPFPVTHTVDHAAHVYEKEIRRFFKLGRRGFPVFDIVLLGIGEDGHTAALFPGDPAVSERKRLAAAVRYSPALNQRITLTIPVFNRARHLFFLVTGKRKEDILPRIVRRVKTFPAAQVKPKGTCTFVCDRPAAGKL